LPLVAYAVPHYLRYGDFPLAIRAVGMKQPQAADIAGSQREQ
jgi:hypothetical protein